MEKDKRKYRFCFIDYMWYVAEICSERLHNRLNGSGLLFLCWLYVVLIPFGTPLALHFFSRVVAFPILMFLCFLPDLFCKLRYTTGRWEALHEHYRGLKHPGRRLAKIVLASITLTAANFALMFHFGFMYWA